MNCFLFFFFLIPRICHGLQSQYRTGSLRVEWMSVQGTLWSSQLCLPLCGKVSQGLVQSWGDTTAGHCVLGRRRELPVQRITCLSPFPCHVRSAEGHIGPEPPPHDDSGGVRPHPHSSPSGCRGHASLGGGRNSLAPVTSALG